MALPLPTIEVSPRVPEARDGLLTAVDGPWDLPDVHVETAGAQYEAEACTDDRLYPTLCRDVPYDAFVYDGREPFRTVFAFNVYASEICTPVGTTLQDAQARVRRRLKLGEQTAVEKALWGGNGSNVTGVFEQMQAAGQVTTVGAAGIGSIEAISILEQTAANAYDGPLYIHARPRMSAYLANRNLLDEAPPSPLIPRSKLGLKRTHFGSTVVFGAGYAGNSPAGVVPDATTESVYITGRVLVWRSPDVRDALSGGVDYLLNRTNNQRAIFAVRTYAIAVECVVAAAVVTRGAAT